MLKPRSSMLRLAEVANAVAATTKKNEKVQLAAEYLQTLCAEDAALAALFLSGRPFPAWEETTLQVGGALLWSAIKEVGEASDTELTAAYRRHGDLGSAAEDVLARSSELPATGGSSGSNGAQLETRNSKPETTLEELEHTFRAIASARGPAAKLELVVGILRRLQPLSVKYVIKMMSGEMRIGLRESLVEEAIARAFAAPLGEVQRGNLLLGGINEVVRLAIAGQLPQAGMRLFHPLGFMLASPAQTAQEAFETIQSATVEDKYDGIRAQAHVARLADGARVKLFSRTRDEITESFPELSPSLATFMEDVVLDGEIVAWSETASETPGLSGALPFFELQKRLGRKRVTEAMMRRVPVAYLVFDVLFCGSELAIDKPLQERRQLLERLFAGRKEQKASLDRLETTGQPDQAGFLFDDETDLPSGKILRAPVWSALSVAELEGVFEQALERGNEGLMIKDAGSAYSPGRRGKSWMKLKRELATLDVVVTAVEYGHGKRVSVLSDYTFAVRQGEKLLNVGKAYSGLTDAEIAELTEWFRAHTLEDFGFRRLVEPTIVLEVAFNAIMRSDRHESGYALRFPRILRLRPDKTSAEIDSLETVKKIYEGQGFKDNF